MAGNEISLSAYKPASRDTAEQASIGTSKGLLGPASLVGWLRKQNPVVLVAEVFKSGSQWLEVHFLKSRALDETSVSHLSVGSGDAGTLNPVPRSFFQAAPTS